MAKKTETKPAKSKEKKEKKADKPKRLTGQNAGPQGFLVEHGEKLAFGAFGLVILLCLFGALTHERYNKTPEQLSQILVQKREAVTKNTPESFERLKSAVVKSYSEEVPRVLEPVAAIDRIPGVGTRPTDQATPRRPEPEYLKPENLQAFPIFEALAMQGPKKKPKPKAVEKEKEKKKDNSPFSDLLTPSATGKGNKGGKKNKQSVGAMDELPSTGPAAAAEQPDFGPRGGVQAPDAEPRLFPGALLVARVPQKKQADLYRKAFEGARDYNQQRDVPHYVTFILERSEDGGKTWTRTAVVDKQEVDLVEAYLRIEKKFAENIRFPEIVEQQHILPLAMKKRKTKDAAGKEVEYDIADGLAVSPLPPILGRDWDEIVAGGFPIVTAGEQNMSLPGSAPGSAPGSLPGTSPGRAPGSGPSIEEGGAAPGQPGEKLPGLGAPGIGGGRPISAPADDRSAGLPGRGAYGQRKGGAKSGGYKSKFGSGGAGSGAPGGLSPGAYGGAGGAGMFSPPGGAPMGGPSLGSYGPKGKGGGYGLGGGAGSGAPKGLSPNAGGSKSAVGGGADTLGGGASEGAAGGQSMDQFQVEAEVPDLLLRFFDFTVQEGKSYQYRVALALENANYGLKAGLLQKPSLAEGEFRFSEFTDWTAPVRISLAGSEVVAGPVRAPRFENGWNGVDSTTLIMRQRHRTTGSVVAHTFQRLEPGQVLNFKARDIKYERAVGGVAEAALPEFEFQSDNLIVDVKGAGERGWPGEMLLLDASGKLVVRSEVTLAKPADEAESTADPKAASRKDTSGSFIPSFAQEHKRLEWVYNYKAPATAAADSTFGGGDTLGGNQP